MRTEHALISAAKKGDTNAFGELVKRYEKYVYTLAFRMMKTNEEAEEVAQDAFVKAFQSLHQFREDGKFVSWLYTIVYRESLNRLRRHNNVMVTIDEHSGLEIWPTDAKSGLEQLTATERITIVRSAINTLRPTEAAVLTLYYLEEYSLREVCQVTGLTSSNAKVVLHRGRQNLLAAIKSMNSKPISDWL